MPSFDTKVVLVCRWREGKRYILLEPAPYLEGKPRIMSLRCEPRLAGIKLYLSNGQAHGVVPKGQPMRVGQVVVIGYDSASILKRIKRILAVVYQFVRTSLGKLHEQWGVQYYRFIYWNRRFGRKPRIAIYVGALLALSIGFLFFLVEVVEHLFSESCIWGFKLRLCDQECF